MKEQKPIEVSVFFQIFWAVLFALLLRDCAGCGVPPVVRVAGKVQCEIQP